jgi:type I restriction enzyme S subunit
MKHDWQKVRLGDIVSTNNVSYSEKDNWDYVNYLDTGNITENKVDSIQKIDLSCTKLPSRARRKIKEGDIIYSTVRPIQKHYGLMKKLPKNLLVSTGFTTISVNSQSDSGFIYYYLTKNDIIAHLQTLAEQAVSTYPSIKASDLENLMVNLAAIRNALLPRLMSGETEMPIEEE